MSCTTCFTDYIVKCQTEIQVYAQLTPLTTYTWVITDKFDHKYEGSVTTDADGFFTIPVADLPDGLLTSYSGTFTLEVLNSSNCKPVNFKMASEYDCVKFIVKNGTYEKNTLGCNFDCTGAVGANTSLIPFTDAATVTIDWDDYVADFGSAPIVQVYHLIYGGIYQEVNVSIEQTFVDSVLDQIIVNNGGVASGYVLIG